MLLSGKGDVLIHAVCCVIDREPGFRQHCIALRMILLRESEASRIQCVNYTHPCGMSETHILWMWLLRSVEIASFEPEYSLRLPVILKDGHSPSIHSWITFRGLIFRQDAGHEM